MKFEEFIKSKSFKVTTLVVGGLILAVLVFSAGVFVGLEKARFSYGFGQSYMRNFGGRSKFVSDRDFINGHGSIGQIAKIDGTTITIKDRDGVEKDVLASDKTTIRSMRKDIKLSDLQVNDFIVVLGTPNAQSQIQAALIRVLPSPDTAPGATMTPMSTGGGPVKLN